MNTTPTKKQTPKKKKKSSLLTPPKKRGRRKKKNPLQRLWTILLIIMIAFIVSDIINQLGDDREPLALSELTTLVQSGEVERIIVRGDELEVELLEVDENGEALTETSKKEVGTALSETLVNYGVTPEQLSTLTIEVKDPTGFGYWIGQLLPFLIPLIMLGFIVWFFLRQVKGTNMKALSFGNSQAQMIDPNNKDKRVTFDDVAGNEVAKQELVEMVEFLKNPKRFISMGAKIPKGVLMTGAPGTGKTMLARAVAGEARVPFFYLSGSDFVEMFVGVGASRVRDLFKIAKRMSPAIIFIDEIDAVGRSRGVGIGGGNDEREQTLNQILVEMDGFEPKEKLIVMAATNRADVLDSALLRPGRFDRRVILELPDRKDRKKILEVHAKEKPLDEDVNLQTIAERTAGFSGADLESLVNEATIMAALANRKKVNQKDMINALEKVMVGPERKSHLASEEEKRVTAYHEAGHAIVASVLPHADPVHKVTIIPRGRAGGFTMKLPLDERRLPTQSVYQDDIAMGLGGYVAERTMFGDITTGPSNDLKSVTATARDMVTHYGMSDRIGPVVIDENPGKTMFGESVRGRQLSQNILEQVDQEVSRIIQEGLVRAQDVIDTHRDAFVDIAETLLEVETLEQHEYNEILKKHGIAIKELPTKKQDSGSEE
jgi:cell division protease FtsH